MTSQGRRDGERPELLAQRYRLGPILGRGGTATVYQGLDERLQREVAVKIFHADGDADLSRRFAAEARLLARLCHPGLVQIFDYGHSRTGPYLVLELLPAASLRDLLLAGPLPVGRTVGIARDLANAMAYIHRAGVVHRDVKPSNVLLDLQGRARLTDFGVAKVLDEAGSTRTGMVLGTAAYLAPEQVRGRIPVGTAADVYAFGLLVIETLTAERAYPGTPVESALTRLRRPPDLPAGLPLWLSRLLEQATATDPTRRPSADRLVELLAAAGAPAEAPADPAASAAVPVLLSTPPPPAAEVSSAAEAPAADTESRDGPRDSGEAAPATAPSHVAARRRIPGRRVLIGSTAAAAAALAAVLAAATAFPDAGSGGSPSSSSSSSAVPGGGPAAVTAPGGATGLAAVGDNVTGRQPGTRGSTGSTAGTDAPGSAGSTGSPSARQTAASTGPATPPPASASATGSVAPTSASPAASSHVPPGQTKSKAHGHTGGTSG